MVAGRGAGAPSDGDFNEFMTDLEAHAGVKGLIVITGGSPPKAGQRARLQRWYESNKARGAVLTDSFVARGGVTALAWFGVTIAAFSRKHFDAALEFVRLPIDRYPSARRVLAHFDANLG